MVKNHDLLPHNMICYLGNIMNTEVGYSEDATLT
jgi:hypothetical protein